MNENTQVHFLVLCKVADAIERAWRQGYDVPLLWEGGHFTRKEVEAGLDFVFAMGYRYEDYI